MGQASGSGGAVPLRFQLTDKPVLFVMIADLLLKALRPGPSSIGSITEFSLIIIDECHHTTNSARSLDTSLKLILYSERCIVCIGY